MVYNPGIMDYRIAQLGASASRYSADRSAAAAQYAAQTQLKIAKLQVGFQREELERLGIPRLELDKWVAQQEVRLANEHLAFAKEQFAFERQAWEKEFKESARRFDLEFAEGKRQFNASAGMQAMEFAASLGGPEDWTRELQYARGVSESGEMQKFLQDLIDIDSVSAAFQQRAGEANPLTAQSVYNQLVNGPTDAQSQEANTNLAGIDAIMAAGAHRVSGLENLDESELSYLFGGGNSLGYDVPRWIRDYYRSRLPGQGGADQA